jgi:hypothetical protein
MNVRILDGGIIMASRVKVFITFLLTTLLVSNTSFANNCLNTVSDSELLHEISLRMSAGSGNTSSSTGNPPLISSGIVSFLCVGSYLKIENISVDTEKVSKKEIYLGSPSKCTQIETALNVKYGTSAQYNPFVVAICTGSYINKYLVKPGVSVSKLNETYLGSPSKCKTVENQVNSVIQTVN